MKEKIYLVCTHAGRSDEKLKFGKLYILKEKLTDAEPPYLYIVEDLDNKRVDIGGLFPSRFKKFTNFEQAKFMSIKLKLGATIIPKPINKQTCDHRGEECIC